MTNTERAISDIRALNCAKTLSQFCKEQNGCQNCIFRKFGADRWYCHIDESGWWDLQEIHNNYEGKKKNRGYL